jgi:hypothetical protein
MYERVVVRGQKSNSGCEKSSGSVCHVTPVSGSLGMAFTPKVKLESETKEKMKIKKCKNENK